MRLTHEQLEIDPPVVETDDPHQIVIWTDTDTVTTLTNHGTEIEELCGLFTEELKQKIIFAANAGAGICAGVRGDYIAHIGLYEFMNLPTSEVE